MTISEKEIIERQLFSDTSRYDDIMDKHWQRPVNRLPMSRLDRAGQFAPFAALTGFAKLTGTTAKIYHRKEYLNARQEAAIKHQLNQLAKTHQTATFNFFDDHSGYYVDFKDTITVVKPERGRAFFRHHPSVPIANIRRITTP